MKYFISLLGIIFALVILGKFKLNPSVVAQSAQSSATDSINSLQDNSNFHNSIQSSEQTTNGNISTESQSQSESMSEHIDEELLLGERNPFMPPKYILDMEYVKPEDVVYIDDRMEAIRRWPLSDYVLIGIIWDVRQPKAMIRDKNNTLHLLKKNQRVGNKDGVISQINEGEMIVLERGVPRVVKISAARLEKINVTDSQQSGMPFKAGGNQQGPQSPGNNMSQQTQMQQQLQNLRQQLGPGMNNGPFNPNNPNNQNNFQQQPLQNAPNSGSPPSGGPPPDGTERR